MKGKNPDRAIMTFNELWAKICGGELNYIIGLFRGSEYRHPESRLVSHVYAGTFSNPDHPMCAKGWDKRLPKGEGFSIWRGLYGKDICKICMKNVAKQKTLKTWGTNDRQKDSQV
jgi:hypothetical protein